MKREDRRRRLAGPLGLALATLVMLSTSGCYKATFVEHRSTPKRQPTHAKWTHHYFLGLIGRGDHDADELCPEGTAGVQTAGDLTTGVVTIATLGIYAPRRVYVTCAQPRTASSAEALR